MSVLFTPCVIIKIDVQFNKVFRDYIKDIFDKREKINRDTGKLVG